MPEQDSIFEDLQSTSRTLAAIAIGGYIIANISQLAFSRKAREAIWERDGGMCQVTGETSRLECAHYSHRRGVGYNDPDNGRLLTVREHYKDHVDNEGHNGLNVFQNRWSRSTLWGRLTEEEKAIVRSEGYDGE